MQRGFLAIVALLLLAACGSARPSGPPENLACGLQAYEVRDTLAELHVYASRMAVARATRQPAVNMLELSAGGEFGSYGAGFLLGWGSVGAMARPVARDDIQIVTGVSTGALMATYAFLGRRDEELKAFYLHLSDAQVYRQRSYLSLLWANSLFDAAGKRRLLREKITSEIVDAVAAAPDTRGLYIGVADLDSGRFLRIDMKKLARGPFPTPAERDDCYRAVIDAATAIEVAFPPVFVDGRMLADGGVRQHVFLVSPDLVLPDDVDMSNVTLRMIALVHGDLGVPDETPGRDGAGGVGNGVLFIAQRVSAIFTDQVLKASLRLANALARDPAVVVGPRLARKLPRFQTYYAAAARAACACRKRDDVRTQCFGTAQASASLFCPPLMQCLAEKGEEEGRQAAATGRWLSIADLPLGTDPVCALPMRPRFR